MKTMTSLLACGLLASFTPTAALAADLAFRPEGKGFSFDTGVLKGQLRAGGQSKGLSSLVHLPTGTRLDRSMGLVGHYRVFSANHRYGNAAWEWPGEASLVDGSVEVRWPAEASRPFELKVRYTWAAPDALDVETTVTAATNLANFESFLACYLSESFTNASVWVGRLPETGTRGFMPAAKQNGTWQVFPRDESAMTLVRDGRWTIAPNPVDWVRMPDLSAPVIVRRAPRLGITAVLMAPREDAFAVLTPEQTEGHYSMYLSLIGRDLKPAETARARARLWIAAGLSDDAIAAGYRKFIGPP